MTHSLFTIGHSNHSPEVFLDLLHKHQIGAVADVRSHPVSRFKPHFNRKSLEASLPTAGVKYVFLGDELGARRAEADVYVGGKVSYELVAKLPKFLEGLERVRRGMETFRLALMCSEKEPLDCHRTILICRHLRDEADICHIHGDGRLESHAELERRLVAAHGLQEGDLFSSQSDALRRAYALQSEKLAFAKPARKS